MSIVQKMLFLHDLFANKIKYFFDTKDKDMSATGSLIRREEPRGSNYIT
jgi:hypothetical protein